MPIAENDKKIAKYLKISKMLIEQ